MSWLNARNGFLLGLMAIGSSSVLGQELDVRGLLKEGSEQAQGDLVEKGDKAYGELLKIIEAGEKDPEYSRAAKVFPAVLEKTGRLTKVTLDEQSASLPQLIRDLNAQCPYRNLRVNEASPNLNRTRLTVRGERTFNGALWEFCGKADGVLDINEGIFDLPKSGKRPSCESWGNVVILDQMEVTRDRDCGVKDRPTSVSTATLSMSLWLDPCFKPISGESVRDIEAVDESGNRLEVVAVRSVDPAIIPGVVKRRQIELKAPAGTKKIARLKGNLWEYVGSGMSVWEIDDSAKAVGQSHKFGDMTLTVTQASFNGNDPSVAFTVEAPEFLNKPEIENPWKPFNLLADAVVVDFDGEKNSSFTTMRNGGNPPTAVNGRLTMSFNTNVRKTTPGNAKSYKLKFIFPTRLEEIRVGFEFKDLELP